MAADRLIATLVDALKQALAEPGEQRLFRSGKLGGLFPGRGGVNSEAAARALREGLLEVVRTETKGRTVLEWVRLTPRGVNFLHEHESPLRALEELRTVLQSAEAAVPLWLAEMRQQLQALADRLAGDSQRWLGHLAALRQRVDESLRRLESALPAVPDSLAEAVPWAVDALTYLERREANGAAGDCPLPELFAAVAEKHAALSVTAFHEGLRRLSERKMIRLLPFLSPGSELPQPEYALLDGAAVYYYAGR
jgi:DNA-binding PadR family transcriptional regulator